MNSQKKNTGIHCKVIWNDQIRRFQFSGTEFSSLQDQVKQLLGLNREFVLKYKDNENDLITVSSTEELACAIDIFSKTDGLIRFTVFPSDEPTVPLLPPHHPVPESFELGGRPNQQFSCRGRGGRGKWGGRGYGSGDFGGRGGDFGGHGGEFQCKNRYEKRKAKLTFKRDMFKAYLNSLEQAEVLTPEEEKKKQMFREKVNRLDQFLENVNNIPSTPSCQLKEEEEKECLFSEKEDDKKYRHHEKFEKDDDRKNCHSEKKWKKKERKQRKKEAKDSYLSEEAKAELKKLQDQVRDKKPAIWALQGQVKEKKLALKEAFVNNDKQKIDQLKNDIATLKKEKCERKEELVPLRQRIFQLKTGK